MRAIPKYRHHRASGLGCVTLYGKDHYLGKYGTPESRAAYVAKIAEWQASDGEPPDGEATVGDLVARYLKHADGYYRKRGRPTQTLGTVKVVCEALAEMYPSMPAAKFGIAQFKALRHRWAVGKGGEGGVCRATANQYASRVREVFRWGVEEGLVPVATFQAIDAVRALERGRSGARETSPIRPVAEADIEAALPFMGRQTAARVLLQRLTGMRPGEVCLIRTCDVDRSGPVWVYRPCEHKTEHRDKARVIPLGPKAQAILGPFLDDADPERVVLVRVNSARKLYEGIPAADSFVRGYRSSIRRACLKAEVKPWHPNQLRHNAATELRKRYGIEAAQLALGHASANTTEIYAEKNLDAVSRIALEVG